MKVSHDKLAFAKTFALVTATTLLILMPEDLIHLLAVAAHYLYEGIAFMVEEVLTHGLGLSKFQAQMVVFYSSLVAGLLLAFGLTRRIPKILAWIKASILQNYLQLRGYLTDCWQRFYARWKVQLLLAQAVSISSLILWSLV